MNIRITKIIATFILVIMMFGITTPVLATTNKTNLNSLVNIITKFLGSSNSIFESFSKIFSTISTSTNNESKETDNTQITVKKDFLTIAKERHDFIRTNGFTYHQGNQIPLSTKVKHVDCSSFVCDVLYHYGYTEFKGAQKDSRYFANKSNMTAKGWKVYDATQAQAGDIVARNGHMEIYAGNGQFYNGGSKGINQTISNRGVKHLKDFTYAIRINKK